MKRCRFGVWLLILLLILGGASTWAMTRSGEPVARMVRQAGEAAFREDWQEAEEGLQGAKQLWERNYRFCATLADHEPMENINGLFAQLEIYARSRDPQNFAAVCAQLSEDVEAIGEAHSLNWWNIL